MTGNGPVDDDGMGRVESASRGLRLLGRHLLAGIPLPHALDLIVESLSISDLPALAPVSAYWQALLLRVESGYSLSEAIARSGPEFASLVDEVRAAEADGSVADALTRVGMIGGAPSNDLVIVEEEEDHDRGLPPDHPAARNLVAAYQEGEPVIRFLREVLLEAIEREAEAVAWSVLPQASGADPPGRRAVSSDRVRFLVEGEWQDGPGGSSDLLARAARRVLLMAGTTYWRSGLTTGNLTFRTMEGPVTFQLQFDPTAGELTIRRSR